MCARRTFLVDAAFPRDASSQQRKSVTVSLPRSAISSDSTLSPLSARKETSSLNVSL